MRLHILGDFLRVCVSLCKIPMSSSSKATWHSEIFIVNSRSTTYAIVKQIPGSYRRQKNEILAVSTCHTGDDGAKTTASTMITMTSTTTTTPIVTVNFQFSHLIKEHNLKLSMWHDIGGWHLFFLSSFVALFLN